MKLRSLVTTSVAVLVSLAVGVVAAPSASAAGPRPDFQLPFPCGQTWVGNSSNSSVHKSWEIDFNRGNTPTADLGDTVVAAAAGTVEISAHQGSKNGFGNLVKINHGGGWYTYYAHLKVRSVSAGARVKQGQKIGEVGNTTKPGNGRMSPHLHFEVRVSGKPYPANIQKAVFNGTTFRYPQQTLTSRNCSGAKASGGGGGSGNPYTPRKVCGSGYSVINSRALGSAGTVYLLYNSKNRYNCVVTMKKTSLGTATATSAFLEVKGKKRITDSGKFRYYAGPVRAAAGSTCVKWGGSIGKNYFGSAFGHCR